MFVVDTNPLPCHAKPPSPLDTSGADDPEENPQRAGGSETIDGPHLKAQQRGAHAPIAPGSAGYLTVAIRHHIATRCIPPAARSRAENVGCLPAADQRPPRADIRR